MQQGTKRGCLAPYPDTYQGEPTGSGEGRAGPTPGPAGPREQPPHQGSAAESNQVSLGRESTVVSLSPRAQ